MILTSLGPDAPFHRAFTPRRAHMPESGAGAALAGGRFNRPGVESRYLATTPETALAEYRAESPLLPPATLVTFLSARRTSSTSAVAATPCTGRRSGLRHTATGRAWRFWKV